MLVFPFQNITGKRDSHKRWILKSLSQGYDSVSMNDLQKELRGLSALESISETIAARYSAAADGPGKLLSEHAQQTGIRKTQ